MTPAALLDTLWDRYAADQPYARRFVELSGDFRNDHVAFRSLARAGGGVGSFVRIFESLGWREAGTLEFPDVHLRAVHLSHPGNLPRVFVSELLADRLPPAAREIVLRLEPDPEPGSDLAGWFAAPRAAPSREDLETLDAVSQYASWLMSFGRRVNHFTAQVSDLEASVTRLRANLVPMKKQIEGAPDSPLRQTATAPSLIPVLLADGTHVERPYAYFEIAQRAPGFEGFLVPQARQLFEMTNPDGRGRDL